MTEKDLLVKIGQAIYLHRKMASDAKKAQEAVQYLKKQGVFKKCTK